MQLSRNAPSGVPVDREVGCMEHPGTMAPVQIRPILPFLSATLLALLAGTGSLRANEGIDDPIHGYYTKEPRDRFTRFKTELEAGRAHVDTSSELAMLRSVLDQLEVPVSSQMLVYSVTSLQKALVSPRRPRALYFNDDTYVGYVPGGRIEVLSLDPELGSIFYIFDRLRSAQSPRVERSEDCMSCHAPHHLQGIPGMVIESVVPGITGGGEKAFRRERYGHDVPFIERFGGWHLTGAEKFPQKWANLLLEYTPAGRQERTLKIGELFDSSRYLRPTSDLLPQLLQEHQVGFVNRVLQGTYRTRVLQHPGGNLATEQQQEIDALAREIVEYLLFKNEAALQPKTVTGDPEFKQVFTGTGPRTRDGRSLRELDLSTRLLKYRCSYMIYSPVFAGMPATLKAAVFRTMQSALGTDAGAEFSYMAAEEKRAIREILSETLPEFARSARQTEQLRADAQPRS